MQKWVIIALGIASLAAGGYWSLQPTPIKPTPPPLVTTNTSASLPPASPSVQATNIATLGGGCFWCLEAVFEKLPGVTNVVSGYAGGATLNPTYKQICEGNTGHAEVVQIHFDPAKISYEELLHVFWQCHDPTTLNRQGADEGTQYRSVIFYHDDAQRAAAESSLKDAAKEQADPIVTQRSPSPVFYQAEDYHQDYFRKNPNAPYCAFVIIPKMRKLQDHKVLPR